MKKLRYLVLVTSLICLSSCFANYNHGSTTGNITSSSDTTINPTTGGSSQSSTSSSGGTSSSSSTSITPPTGPVDLDFYCINDFHGRVLKNDNEESTGGIARLATYLKKQESDNKDGSVFLSAGDTWQDTYDSAMNRGELLTKSLVEMDCEAMALGNHEFDWGLDEIRNNKAIAENESNKTKTNFLGCNIYNYEGGRVTTQASDLASPYKVIVRKGVKIGLIGAIGQDQISSITSSAWENLTFLDPVPIVKDLSDELRVSQGCDVIIYLLHASVGDSGADELSEISSVSGKPYVDVGFCAHSHQYETALYNSTPWIQNYCHGAVLGKVSLTVDDGDVTINSYPDYNKWGTEYDYGYGKGSSSIYACAEDASVKAIVDSYLTTSFINEKNSVVGSFDNCNGTVSRSNFGVLQAYATSKYIDKLKLTNSNIPNIDVVINNGARPYTYELDADNVTKEDIFNLSPFTNKTIIASVRGADIANECISYSNPYYLPGEQDIKLNDNTYYNVAVIDYLLLHKNPYTRSYNYFSSYTLSIYVIDESPYEIITNYLLSTHTYDMSTVSAKLTRNSWY